MRKGAYHLADLSASGPRTVHHAVVLEVDTGRLFAPMLLGIDCAQPLTASKAKALAAAGAKFAVRYLVPASYQWKRLIRAEADAIMVAGMRLASVYQEGARAPAGGATAGTADGRKALAEAKAIGQPIGSAIFFAVDYDAHEGDFAAIEAYLRAAAVELPGYHVGVYGHCGVIEAMAARKACRYFWQTYAWSGGKKSKYAHLWQYENDTTLAGHPVDLCECYDVSIFWGEAREDNLVSKDPDVTVIVNGKRIDDGVIIDSRVYVPLRAAGDAIEADVHWDAGTRTATLTTR